MSQREIQLNNVIIEMNANTSLTDLLGSRIFRGKPIGEPTGPFCILNIVTKPSIEVSNEVVRVEARIIGNDVNVTLAQLMTIKNAITDHFEATKNHNGFKTYKIAEGGNFYNSLDEKQRNILIQDYLFYFATF